MGILKDFKEYRAQKKQFSIMQMLNGRLPIAYTGQEDVFLSDMVQACINCNVQELTKLQIQHIVKKNGNIKLIEDKLQVTLNEPNWHMTQADFISKIGWQLYLKSNCFIWPIYKLENDEEEKGVLKKDILEFRVLDYQKAEIGKDANGTPAVKLTFGDNSEYILKYADVIHIKEKYSVNEYFGGNLKGEPDFESLRQAISVNDYLMKSIINGVSTAYNMAGVLKYNTVTDEKKIPEKIKEFEKRIKNNDSAILGIDMKYEFTPLTNSLKLIDKDLLAYIDEKICKPFGVSIAILTGDFTKAQYEAYFQKTIEPKINVFEQAFTKTIFTRNQKTRGHKIRFYFDKLLFMTNSELAQYAQTGLNIGAISINNYLELYGQQPVPHGNRYVQSLNYVEVGIADQYQLTRAKAEQTKTPGEKEVINNE